MLTISILAKRLLARIEMKLHKKIKFCYLFTAYDIDYRWLKYINCMLSD